MEKFENVNFDDLEWKALINEKNFTDRLVDSLLVELKNILIKLQKEFKKSFVIDDDHDDGRSAGTEKLNETVDPSDEDNISTLKYLIENRSKLINEFVDNVFAAKNQKSFYLNKFFMDNIDEEARLIINHIKEKKQRLIKFKRHLQNRYIFCVPTAVSHVSSTSYFNATEVPSTNIMIATHMQTMQSFAVPPPTTWRDAFMEINHMTTLLQNLRRTEENSMIAEALIRLSQSMADLIRFMIEHTAEQI